MKKTFILAALLCPLTIFAKGTTYELDASHSIVSFKIGHLIGKVQGSFSDFSGEINLDQNNIKTFQTSATINVDSISTNNQKRDAHLKNADFFDIENKDHPEYKTIAFEAKNFQSTSKDANGTFKGTLNGFLTMHGVKKAIALDTTINANPVMDPFGNARVAVSAKGTLKRQDFGLTWKHPAGELVVGNDVAIELEIQGTRKLKSPATAQDKPKSKKVLKKKSKVKRKNKSLL